MRRIVLLIVAVMGGLSACGCGSLGWYRAAGHFPGVAASDYAFYNFCGTSSQVFQFLVPDVESAALEALFDLDFKLAERPQHHRDGEVLINAKAPDGRCVKITITPQNDMSNMRITFGPGCIGDELLSRDVLKRVALNFGTLPRDYTPLEPTLARRINRSRGIPPRAERTPPPPLAGEGLRPGELRGAIAGEGGVPGAETAPPTSLYGPYTPGQPYVPTPFGPYPAAALPYSSPVAPLPYTPYNTDIVY
jgi:hypothetical protein